MGVGTFFTFWKMFTGSGSVCEQKAERSANRRYWGSNLQSTVNEGPVSFFKTNKYFQ